MASKILAFIQSGSGSFGGLALDLFARQYALNAPYRAYCDSLGRTPDEVGTWREIPAVPAVAFKRHTLSCIPVDQARVVFHSSGTTASNASRHIMDADALALYEASLLAGFRQHVVPDRDAMPLWSLVPPPSEAPHSSLSFMVASLMRQMSSPHHRWFWQRGLLGEQALAAMRGCDQPIILFGTALAWLSLFESFAGSTRLAEGSRVVETGGFKGRSRNTSRDALYRQFTDRMGVAPPYCVAEYGMSELASQYYDDTLVRHLGGAAVGERQVKVGVPWCRAVVTDPVTGDEVGMGEQGLLTHYDLANLNSAFAIVTEDLGVRVPGGFVLVGRAPGAEMRGCSLSVG